MNLTTNNSAEKRQERDWEVERFFGWAQVPQVTLLLAENRVRSLASAPQDLELPSIGLFRGKGRWERHPRASL